jgi:hypothetical protein
MAANWLLEAKFAIVVHHAAVKLAPLNRTRALGQDYGALVARW